MTKKIQSFHFPEGLAAIEDKSGSYHIDKNGKAAYNKRFIKTFGFYDNIATVKDKNGYFHIDVNGKALHSKRFKWSGNFQNGLCVVRDKFGFFHINKIFIAAYSDRFQYTGDFKYNIAVAYKSNKSFHINERGEKIYKNYFDYAELFHKGSAVVKKNNFFFHINKKGIPIHNLKLARIEPFYNNQAFCTDKNNRHILLNETGHYTLLNTNEIIDTKEILKNIADNKSIVLMLRHADRHKITSQSKNWGNDIRLNKKGISKSLQLGHSLQKCEIQCFSSPIKRCKETAENILKGSKSSTIKCPSLKILGDPGIFFDGTYNHEKEMKENYYLFMDNYLNNGFATGMTPLAKASEILIKHYNKKTRPGVITIFISHDLHVASFLEFLGLKKPNKNDWCDYLEGVCMIKDGNNIEWKRFKQGRDF